MAFCLEQQTCASEHKTSEADLEENSFQSLQATATHVIDGREVNKVDRGGQTFSPSFGRFTSDTETIETQEEHLVDSVGFAQIGRKFVLTEEK